MRRVVKIKAASRTWARRDLGLSRSGGARKGAWGGGSFQRAFGETRVNRFHGPRVIRVSATKGDRRLRAMSAVILDRPRLYRFLI